MSPLVIGLTGGIGVGKSTVASLMVARGAEIIDVDRLGRLVLEPNGEAFEAVVAAFGQELLDAQGSIDRGALAGMVFGDRSRLDELEAISHPAINARLEVDIATSESEVVVLDMAVLTESGLARVPGGEMYDRVIVVESRIELRMLRLIERGLSTAEASGRVAAQATDDARRLVADLIIENNGDLAALEASVALIWPTVEAWRLQCRFTPAIDE